MCGAEGEEEIPDAGAYLHAVGVAFAVVGGFADGDPGLIVGLMDICHAYARCCLKVISRDLRVWREMDCVCER